MRRLHASSAMRGRVGLGQRAACATPAGARSRHSTSSGRGAPRRCAWQQQRGAGTTRACVRRLVSPQTETAPAPRRRRPQRRDRRGSRATRIGLAIVDEWFHFASRQLGCSRRVGNQPHWWRTSGHGGRERRLARVERCAPWLPPSTSEGAAAVRCRPGSLAISPRTGLPTHSSLCERLKIQRRFGKCAKCDWSRRGCCSARTISGTRASHGGTARG